MKGYPTWFSSKFISYSMFFLILTGMFLIPGVLEIQLEQNVPWRLTGGARLFTTAVHVIVSYFVLMLTGSLWSIHMRREWRRSKKRISGILVGVILILLSISAISLLYSGNDQIQFFSSLGHSILGITFLVIYPIHLYLKSE